MQIRVPEMGPRFRVLPSYVFNRRPRKLVQIAAPKIGPWIHRKYQKNVPRVNKLGPKRAPKVVCGEGEQHLGPEMGNNISWPEMGTIAWGETHLRRKPMSTPRATLAALRRGVKKTYLLRPHFWDRETVILLRKNSLVLRSQLFWGRPEIVLGSAWGRSGVIMESFWGRSLVFLRFFSGFVLGSF